MKQIMNKISILTIALIITVLSAVSMPAQTDLKVLESPVPKYPPAAKAIHASGVVTCQVKINREGNVVKAECLTGHPLLRTPTKSSVEQWKFNTVAEETERETVITMEYLKYEEKLVEFKNPLYVIVGTERDVIYDTSCISDYSEAKFLAFQLSKNQAPGTEWNSDSWLKGDFDYDGIEDFAISGKRDGKFVVGIGKKPLTNDSKYWTLEFAEDSSSQSGLCSVADAKISLEKLSSDKEIAELQKLPKKSRGINLADDQCDAFHIYYSREKDQFVWRRN